MNKHSTLPTILAFAAVATLAAYPAISQTVGINAAVRNIVKVKADAQAEAVNAKVKEKIALGNMIATAAASALQILLLDKSSLTVGPNARMTIDRFVYDPNRKTSALGASVARGTFRFLSGKALQGRPGQSGLSTPIASIGIRGTIVEGAVGADAVAIAAMEQGFANAAGVDPETASLIVLRGPGAKAVASEKRGAIDVTAGGKTVTVNDAGQAIFVPGPGMAPIGPFPLSNAGFQAFDAVLRTQPNARALAAVAAGASKAASGRGGASSSGGGSGASALQLGLGFAAAVGVAVAVGGGNSSSP